MHVYNAKHDIYQHKGVTKNLLNSYIIELYTVIVLEQIYLNVSRALCYREETQPSYGTEAKITICLVCYQELSLKAVTC
jgi:hypothetical protein